MSTRSDFNMLRCRDAESDSCDILLWDAYATQSGSAMGYRAAPAMNVATM
jgi:hypothetical protein